MTVLLDELAPIDISTETEIMGIAVDAAGLRHADYPTASRTLCGIPDGQMTPGDDSVPPTCLPCRVTAAKYDDGLDCSVPPAWFRNGVVVPLCIGWSRVHDHPCRRAPRPGMRTCKDHGDAELTEV